MRHLLGITSRRRRVPAPTPTRGVRTALVAASVALLALALAPDVAHACAVCFDPRSENRFAFLATTAFLSLLPLGMVAGAGAFIRRRVREMDAEAADEDGTSGPGADSRADG